MVHDGRCTATTKAGERCRGRALPGEAACWNHSPRLNARRAAWRAKGGQNRSNDARAAALISADALTPHELVIALSHVFRRVNAGQVEPNVANCLGNLAKTIAEITKTSDFEQRIAALEGAQQPLLRKH